MAFVTRETLISNTISISFHSMLQMVSNSLLNYNLIVSNILELNESIMYCDWKMIERSNLRNNCVLRHATDSMIEILDQCLTYLGYMRISYLELDAHAIDYATIVAFEQNVRNMLIWAHTLNFEP